LQAANYLDIKGLLDVTCKTVANMIKGKTPEEIRKTFNIKNDFTPAEEEQVLSLIYNCNNCLYNIIRVQGECKGKIHLYSSTCVITEPMNSVVFSQSQSPQSQTGV